MTRKFNHDADFQQLIKRRRKFIDGLDANRGEINLDIFEDFYPDRAHFVYELLQNAEDAGATEVLGRLNFQVQHPHINQPEAGKRGSVLRWDTAI